MHAKDTGGEYNLSQNQSGYATARPCIYNMITITLTHKI